MSETQEKSAGRSRRRRRSRRRAGGQAHPAAGGQQKSHNARKKRRSNGQKRTPVEKFGGREPRGPVARVESTEFNCFEVFCAYHLGITEDNRYRKQSLKEVARRFERSPDEIVEVLNACGMDAESLKGSGFDISFAQLDVKVAPEGIDKREIAKGLFEEFTAALPNFREWEDPVKEIEASEEVEADLG